MLLDQFLNVHNVLRLEAEVHRQLDDWIDPVVELAVNFSLRPKQVTEVKQLIEEHLHEIRGAWAKHFPSGSH